MNLDVYLRGRLVGRITGTATNIQFNYDAGYLALHDPTPLSLSMPLAYEPYTHSTVAPYLWGLLPDNDRVLRRWAHDYECREGDVLGLLAGAGREVAGAAEYVPAGEPPDDSTDGSIDWYTEHEVAEHLRSIRADNSLWHVGRSRRWSLAGAQAKIALHHDSATDRWGNPNGHTPTTHILKPPLDDVGDGFAAHDINEHLSLTAAGLAGLVVARTEIRQFDDQRVLVVTRYDRVASESGRIERVHQEDVCQSLGVHPDQKYESDGGPGVQALADLVREHTPADRMALLRALIFNWAIAAPDAHAKNYSMLLGGSNVRLAPLYDIASGLLLYDHRQIDLAQKVGGERRVAYIRRRHWERVADQFKLSRRSVMDEANELVATIPDAYDTAVAGAKLTGTEQRSAEQLAGKVRAWAALAHRNLHTD